MPRKPREVSRCEWCGTDPLYVAYHDAEWGVPVHDDRKLFEFLTLESAQAGLSWITVLRKRENYRRLFAGFDPQRVARFNRRSVERLLKDAGIIRNRQKVEAAITNAKRFPRSPRRVREFRRVLVAVRGWRDDRESLEDAEGHPRYDRGVGRVQP